MEMHSASSLREARGLDARSAGRGGGTFAGWFLWIARQLAAVLERRRRIGKDIEQLQRMDDRTLADIGIPRGEIEAALRHGRRR